MSGSKFSGPVTVTLYASADSSISGDDPVLATVTLTNLKLRAFASKVLTLKFTYSNSLAAGSYDLIASVDATATNDASAQVVSAAASSSGRRPSTLPQGSRQPSLSW